MKSRIVAGWLALVGLFATAVVPPMPVQAGVTANTAPITLTGASAPLVIYPLVGQSTMTVESVSNTGLTLSYYIFVGGTYEPVAGSSYDQTISNVTTSNSKVTLTFPVGGTQAFEIVPSGSGTAVINYRADSTTTKVIGAGVNGGKTTVTGSGPVTVTNSGSTVTVGLTDPLPILYGGTGATALPTGCLQSNGTAVISTGTACASGSGVTSVTGTSPIIVSAGPSPNVSITAAPSFSNLTDTSLVTGNCLYASNGGLVTDGSQTTTGTLFLTTAIPQSYTAGNSYNITVASPLPQAISANSTINVVNPSTSASALAFTTLAYAKGYTGGVGIDFFGSVNGNSLNFYSGGSSTPITLFSTGNGTSYASTTNFFTYTYTLPSASTVSLPTNTWLEFYNSANSYGFYATLASPLSIGDTTLSYYVQGQIGSPPSSINNVNVSSIAPGSFGSASACVTSIASGSGNVTVAQPSPGYYTIAVSTPSPVPTASPVTVSAGTGISVATPSAGTFVVSNTGVTAVTGTGNVQVTSGPTPAASITNSPVFTGVITVGAVGTGSTTSAYAIGSTGLGGSTYVEAYPTPYASSHPASGIQPTLLGVSTASTTQWLALDNNGNLGVYGTLNGTGATLSGLTAGRCVQTSTGGLLTVASAACASGGGAAAALPLGLSTQLNADVPYNTNFVLSPEVSYIGLNGNTIKSLSVSCLPLNTSDTNTPYTTPIDSTGITGGTYTFYDYGSGTGAGTTIGTVTIPNAPQAGPYTNYVITTLGSAYTLPAGHHIIYSVSGTSNSSTNQWQGCQAYIGI